MESTEATEGEESTREGEEARLDEDKNKAKEKSKKVLVAIDNSDESFYALKWALDYLFSAPPSISTVHPQTQAGHEEEGTVILLHVLQPFHPYIVPPGPAIYATPDLVRSVRKAQEQNTAALLARASDLCKGIAIKVETLVLDGEPRDMICQAAEDTKSDLLVIGSRGLGMIKRAFLGSVSDYCAHHAKCPILIVKPPK